jgi:hypothetical protein
MPGKQIRNRGNAMIGKVFGHLMVMNRLTNLKSGSVNLRARVVCDCTCGSRIIVPTYYFTRKHYPPKQNCGPRCTGRTPNPTPQVLKEKSLYPEYRIYNGMVFRCTDPQAVGYKDYKDLGIQEEWLDPTYGFQRFFAYLGKMPTPKHTLDRMNNEIGYMIGNVRWATLQEQHANRRTPQEKAAYRARMASYKAAAKEQAAAKAIARAELIKAEAAELETLETLETPASAAMETTNVPIQLQLQSQSQHMEVQD